MPHEFPVDYRFILSYDFLISLGSGIHDDLAAFTVRVDSHPSVVDALDGRHAVPHGMCQPGRA